MGKRYSTDICVIGGGSAGLSIIAGAQQMGADTLLVEKGKMGGDCLNYGCVPSKSLLAAGKAAKAGKDARAFGVDYPAPQIDFQRVHDHVEGVIAGIAPHDSQERFEGLGATVLREAARFNSPTEIQVGEDTVTARRFVIATGSSAFIPPIPGLQDVSYLTNETIFTLTEKPDHLIVIGGGPIGCELGQAYRHLGADVTVVEMFSIMPKDDPELVEVVRQRLTEEGMTLAENTQVKSVAPGADGKGVVVTVEKDGQESHISGSHLLVAAGRAPNVEGLNLEAAGIDYDRRGIKVDKGLRTSNRKVYAAGDVAGGFQFTHMAGYDAGIIIKSALFRLPAKVDHKAVPWVSFTEPELANVGMTEAMAKAAGESYQVLSWPFKENDRARAEHQTEGLAKVIITPKGKILGAALVGHGAGEQILPWGLAIANKLKIGAMATVIAPYPTYSEINKRAAGSFYSPKLFSEKTKRIVRFLAKFG
ncbi:dihydrolipoyl dehydrogenase family protein [Rhodovibrionaceae bacterium A322]